MQPDHCKLIAEGDHIRIVALDQKALPHIKVNGVPLSSMEGVVLKPNDRIAIGPGAMFLFKNKSKEAEASMPDPDDDPISFDFAADELANVENK